MTAPRWLRTAIKVVAVNLLVLSAIWYAVYWRYRRTLPSYDLDLGRVSLEMGIPPAVLHGIGFLVNDEERRNFHTLPLQRPNWIRIGAFGDSFTFGDEVDAPLSYPAQLQRLFGEEASNVEVINFGGSALSFQETTWLWESYGKRFDLAFVLIGPRGLISNREMTFNHLFERSPGAVHGRFVLDGDDLRWVEPAGGLEGDDRTAQYLRFLTPWRYLRYDRSPPMALRAMLPRNKTVANPLYYTSRSPDEELAALYPALLKRWQRSAPQVVFTQVYLRDTRYALGMEGDLASVDIGLLDSFVYRRTRGHFSGAGNHQIARLYKDVLTDRSPGRLDVLRTAAQAQPLHWPHQLDEFSHGELYLAGRHAATLEYFEIPHADQDQSVDFKRDGVRSLLFLGGEQELLSSPALTSDRPLRAGASLRAILECEGHPFEAEVGAVKLVDDAGAIGEVASAAFPNLLQNQFYLSAAALGAPPGACRGRLELDGRPLFTVEPDAGANCRLRPLAGRAVGAIPTHDTMLDVPALPSNGEVSIRFDGIDHVYGTFVKSARELPWTRAGLHAWIRPSATPGRAELSHR